LSATILSTSLQTLAPALKPQFDIVTSPLQRRIIEQCQVATSPSTAADLATRMMRL